MVKERRNARLRLIQELYAELVSGKLDWTTKDFKEYTYDKEYYKSLKNTVLTHKDKIKKLVEEFSPHRSLKDTNPVDLAILLVGISEAFILKEVPVKVAINEAIEIAKLYGNANSYKYVNGVLGALLKNKFQDALKE